MIEDSINDVKHIFNELFDELTGGAKRRAAAVLAKEYGAGGQSYVAKEFNISRDTIRKGTIEIETGEEIEDKFKERGRESTLEKMPQLEGQIHEILASQSQIDPKFQTERLYTKLTASEIRNQLIKRYGYKDEDLPTERTFNTIVNDLGYGLKTVMKTKPVKKIEETELIFYNLDRIHNICEENEDIVRLSIDTKDRVKIGEFSRGGESRVKVEAYDHDFGDKYAVPFGIYNFKDKTVEIYISETKVTADFMVDRLEEYWVSHGYSNSGKKLLLNADNGPENNSQRTQFVKRMVEFSAEHNTEVIMAYYPPYHSKYNPVERIWGALEQHWNGDLLDTTETVVKYAESMTYDKKHPVVAVIDKVYETGVKVSKKIMRVYEKALDRMAGLEKWFVRISPDKCRKALSNFRVAVV
jgi:hypothetical protein